MDRNIFKRSVSTATLLASVLATGAFAADLSITGRLSETLEASDNYFLVTKPSGTTVKSWTAGTLDFLARTPTTSYLLDTNYSYYKYLGPGAADTHPTWGTPASAAFRVDHLTELDRYKFNMSWMRTDAATTQLTQSGVANAHGVINTFDVNGSVAHDVGRNDTIQLTTDASKVQFTDPTQTPYTDVSSTVAWVHSVSQTVTWTNSANFDWFAQENTANSQRLMWRLTTGLQAQLTQRLSAHGDFGWAFANAYQNGNANSSTIPFVPGVTPFQPLVGAGNGWFGDVGLDYRLLKDTNVSVGASRAIVPLFTGQLQQAESFNASLFHEINQLSNLSVFASYVQASSAGQIGQTSGTASDFFSAGISYGYRLTREWRSNLSYTFRENIGVAKSSTILLSLAYDFTALGNSNAINQAEQERARQRARQSIGQVFPGFQ